MRHPPADAEPRRSHPHRAVLAAVEDGTERAVPVDDRRPGVSDLVGSCGRAQAERDRHPGAGAVTLCDVPPLVERQRQRLRVGQNLGGKHEAADSAGGQRHSGDICQAHRA